MPVDIYQPRTLQRAIEIRDRPVLWYSTMYFQPPEEVSPTRTLDRDVQVASRKMAPLQRPRDTSAMLGRDGFSTSTIHLPYMKPGRETGAEEFVNSRAVGANMYTPNALIERARRQLGRDIEELDDMIERRKEYMAAQGAITGVTPLVSVNADGSVTQQAEVDWQMPATHKITLTSTDLWTDTDDSDPLANFRTWAQLCVRDGRSSPDICTVGSAAAEALRKHPQLERLLDNRRIEIGTLELRERSITDINYVGRLQGIDIYEDTRVYEDDAGALQLYTPADRLVLGSRSAENRWAYGPISDVKCPNPLVMRWVKTWDVDEPSAKMVAVHSSCLPCLWWPGALISAKVV